jgi:hypothetical protein
MSFVCLAVTMVLFISLFLYFRQKILALEEKLKLLSEVTTTMAGITSLQHAPPTPKMVAREPESESEEEEEEEDASSYSGSEDSVSIEELYDTSPVMTFNQVDSAIKNVIVMSESVPQLDFVVEQMTFPETIKKVLLAPVESVDLAPVESVDLAPVDSVDLAPVESVDLAPVESVDLAPVEPVDLKPRPIIHSVNLDEGLPKRVVSNDDVKTLNLDSPYDAMSLKELKEKVAETNGPKLKTKKELIEYLKNKM